jgi:hypothetical protein
MADINYRPSHLPTKLGTIKNQDSGHLFELLGLLDIEMAEYLFSGNETSLDYADIINNSFGEFQTWLGNLCINE